VRGYFHWTLVDNFEWAEGFQAKFGLASLDRATQARTLRPSAMVLRDVIARHAAGEIVSRPRPPTPTPTAAADEAAAAALLAPAEPAPPLVRGASDSLFADGAPAAAEPPFDRAGADAAGADAAGADAAGARRPPSRLEFEFEEGAAELLYGEEGEGDVAPLDAPDAAETDALDAQLAAEGAADAAAAGAEADLAAGFAERAEPLAAELGTSAAGSIEAASGELVVEPAADAAGASSRSRPEPDGGQQ
jgi:hypothetical protein